MPERRVPFRRSILAGALPLIAGRGVFEAWRITGLDVLMTVGMAVIAVGVFATFWGVRQLLGESARETVTDWTSRSCKALAALLLLACYPVAAWTTLQVIEIETTYGIEIVNDSSSTVTSWAVENPGGAQTFAEPIASGDRDLRRLDGLADGPLSCSIQVSDGSRHRILVEGYVTNGMGGDARIVLDRSGSATLHRR